MPVATFTIQEGNGLKTKETRGRQSTLYEVRADGGRRFTTFDAGGERARDEQGLETDRGG